MEDSRSDKWRQEAWDTALHCFGWSHIYQRRLRRKQSILRAIVFLGLGVPLVAGASALSVGLTPMVVVVLSILGIAQIVLSLWALVYRLDEGVATSLRGSEVFQQLSRRFREMGNTPPSNEQVFEMELKRAKDSYDDATRMNTEQHVTEKETRRAHRAGLREFRRACSSCKQTPTSMTSTKCDVCGNF